MCQDPNGGGSFPYLPKHLTMCLVLLKRTFVFFFWGVFFGVGYVPLRTNKDMVKSAWVIMRHFLQHLDPNIQKETRLERLNMKII